MAHFTMGESEARALFGDSCPLNEQRREVEYLGEKFVAWKNSEGRIECEIDAAIEASIYRNEIAVMPDGRVILDPAMLGCDAYMSVIEGRGDALA